jgi:TolA-binding protein
MIIVLSIILQACAHRVQKSSKNKKPKVIEFAQKVKPAPVVSIVSASGDKDQQPVQVMQSDMDEEEVKDWKLPENDKLYFELSGEKYEGLNSNQVYEKIIEKYRGNDLKALEAYMNLLLIKYPQSHFADNALYLQGMLAFSIKSYAKSLEAFQKIIKLYPNGNKAVSALFAKGILYKKLNLKTESENVLSNVKVKYPGSPESLRADAEIKILKQ